MTAIKICGINSEAAFDAAIDCAADYIGFNFFPASPRHVTPERAATLSARHPGGPRRVALFVDPTDADIASALAALRFDVLQLYVATDRAAELRSFGLPIWRAVAVSAESGLPAPSTDTLLVESKAPPDAKRPGGNAASFDWSLLAGWSAPKFWVLAGGLNPGNVAAAIHATAAPVVDVASGVESSIGVKDPDRIRAFAAAARAA